jgi:phosphate transport system protein
MHKFHQELIQLKNKIIEMGQFALTMLNESVVSLRDQNLPLADKVYADRKKLNQYEVELDEWTLRLIALYQPMAKDLRTIACALKTITYLHRIGRYGKDISNVTRQTMDRPHFKKLISIPRMEQIVAGMLHDVLAAFDREDLTPIENMEKRDDEVDELRFEIFRECVSYMMEDPKVITQGAHYLMVARYLERCGDHACKIAEKVYYMVTGEYTEIK